MRAKKIMSETCPTVRIVNSNAPGGYVVINKSDYDEKKHTLYVEKAAPTPQPQANAQAVKR